MGKLRPPAEGHSGLPQSWGRNGSTCSCCSAPSPFSCGVFGGARGEPHCPSRLNPRAAELGHCPEVGVAGKVRSPRSLLGALGGFPFSRVSPPILAMVLGESGYLILGCVIIFEKFSEGAGGSGEGRGSGEKGSQVLVLFGTKFAALPSCSPPAPLLPNVPVF